MQQKVRRWLRGVLTPLEADQSASIEGPSNFSRSPSFDNPDEGFTAYWTWVRDETSSWTLIVRVRSELHFPLEREYEVEVSLMVAEEQCSALVPNVPILVGVRCPAATILLTPGAA